MLSTLTTSLSRPTGASQRISLAVSERDAGDATGDTGFESFNAKQQRDADPRKVAPPPLAQPRLELFAPQRLDNPAIFPYASASPGHEFIDLIEARRAYESGLSIAQAVETSLGALLDGKL